MQNVFLIKNCISNVETLKKERIDYHESKILTTLERIDYNECMILTTFG